MKKLLLLFSLLLSTALTHAAAGDGVGIYLVGTFNYNNTTDYATPRLQFKETATPYLYLIEASDITTDIDALPGKDDDTTDDNVISIEGNGNTVDNFRFVSEDSTTISLGSNGNKLVKDAAYQLNFTTDNIYTGNVNGSDKWSCTRIFLYYNTEDNTIPPTILFTDKEVADININADFLIYSGNFVDIYARGALNNWGNDGRLTSEYQFMETDVPNVYVWQRQDGSKLTFSNGAAIKFADSGWNSNCNLGSEGATITKEEMLTLVPNSNNSAITSDITCARVFLCHSNATASKVIFTDRTLEEILADETINLVEYKQSDIYLCHGNDVFEEQYRFLYSDTEGVYVIENENGFTLNDRFKITTSSDGTKDTAWAQMNLGCNINGGADRQIELNKSFALVSGNNPKWINETNQTITFKKAYFVDDPLFPALFLTDDADFTWNKGQASQYYMTSNKLSWGVTNNNNFIATKYPGVYEFTGRITFSEEGTPNDSGGWSKDPDRFQIKSDSNGDGEMGNDEIIFGSAVVTTDSSYLPVNINVPYTLTRYVGNASYYRDVISSEDNLPFTFHKVFFYCTGDDDEAPEIYLVSDVNFDARPLEVLQAGFPINLFMRASNLDNGKNGIDDQDARHDYQFYTTDQPNIYVNERDYTVEEANPFRVGSKGREKDATDGGIVNPWRVELGDIANAKSRIELNKVYGMANNSGTDNHTAITAGGNLDVKRTVLYYDGSAIPKIVLYNTEHAIEPNPTYVGRSLYGLQVWQDAQYKNDDDEQAAWDSSGGLYKCFTANQNNANFMSDYLMDMNDAYSDYIQKMIMFYGPVNRDEIKNDENYSHLYTEAEHGGNVYVIDFTQDYTAAYNAANGTGVDTNGDNVDDINVGQGDKGIYVKVPRMSEKDDAKYAAVPEHFRTGVRFTIFNYNYVPQSLTDVLNERKFVKYGHAFRLNEILRPLRGKLDAGGNWSETTGYKWELNTDGTTFTRTASATELWNNGEAPTTSIKVANQKIGDNRILSEYNFYLYRIILEVVNDGKNQDEQLFIRFEGRYDLEGKLDAKRTYYFSGAQGENGVSTEPNIFIGTEFTGRDRAFTRYHSNRDRSLLGNITDEELNELIAQGMYPNLNMGYTATSTYKFYDAAGNELSAFDNNQLYYEGFVNSNVKDADNRVIADNAATVNENAKYATSTREFSDVQGSVYNKTFFFDPAMTTGVPTSYKVSTEYSFYDQKYTPGPYVTTGNFGSELGFTAEPSLTAEKKQRGSGDYDGWYNSTLTITPGQATLDGETLPVTRYTITQHDTSVNQPVYAESYVNNSDNLTDWAKGMTHDATNKDTRLVLDNVWITHEAPQTSIVPAAADEVKTPLTQKLGNGVTETTIQYDLTQHYTVGLPQGLYTLDQISAAGLLSEELTAENSGNNTATKGDVVYKLQDVTGRATATATFLESDNNTTGIDSVDYDNVEVTVDGNAIVILGTDAEAAIYNTSGQAIYIGTDRRIEVVQGVYIVNVAGKVKKVAVL